MSKNPCVKVEATVTFKRKLRNFRKKYRHVSKDIKPIIKQKVFSIFLKYLI